MGKNDGSLNIDFQAVDDIQGYLVKATGQIMAINMKLSSARGCLLSELKGIAPTITISGCGAEKGIVSNIKQSSDKATRYFKKIADGDGPTLALTPNDTLKNNDNSADGKNIDKIENNHGTSNLGGLIKTGADMLGGVVLPGLLNTLNNANGKGDSSKVVEQTNAPKDNSIELSDNAKKTIGTVVNVAGALAGALGDVSISVNNNNSSNGLSNSAKTLSEADGINRNTSIIDEKGNIDINTSKAGILSTFGFIGKLTKKIENYVNEQWEKGNLRAIELTFLIEDLDGKINAKEKDRKDLDKQLIELKNKHPGLDDNIKTTEDRLEAIKTEIKAIEDGEFYDLNKSKDRAIKDREDEQKRLNSELQQLEGYGEYKKLKEKMQKLDEEIFSLRSQKVEIERERNKAEFDHIGKVDRDEKNKYGQLGKIYEILPEDVKEKIDSGAYNLLKFENMNGAEQRDTLSVLAYLYRSDDFKKWFKDECPGKKFTKENILQFYGVGEVFATDASVDVRSFLMYDDDKINDFLYIKNIEGDDEAYKFVHANEDDINQVLGMKDAERAIERVANGEPIEQVFSTFGEGVTDGVIGAFNNTITTFNRNTTRTVNEYKAMYFLQMLMGADEAKDLDKDEVQKRLEEGYKNGDISEEDYNKYKNREHVSEIDFSYITGNMQNSVYEAWQKMLSDPQYQKFKESVDNSEFKKSVLNYSYQIGANVGNMIPSQAAGMLTGGAGLASSLTLLLSAYGGSYKESKNSGYDEFSSNAFALLSAASEVTTEYFLGKIAGIGKGKELVEISDEIGEIASRMDIFKNHLLTTASDILGEIKEEEIQNVLDAVFKTMVYGDSLEAGLLEQDWIGTAIVTAGSTGIMNMSTNVGNMIGQNINYSKGQPKVSITLSDGSIVETTFKDLMNYCTDTGKVDLERFSNDVQNNNVDTTTVDDFHFKNGKNKIVLNGNVLEVNINNVTGKFTINGEKVASAAVSALEALVNGLGSKVKVESNNETQNIESVQTTEKGELTESELETFEESPTGETGKPDIEAIKETIEHDQESGKARTEQILNGQTEAEIQAAKDRIDARREQKVDALSQVEVKNKTNDTKAKQIKETLEQLKEKVQRARDQKIEESLSKPFQTVDTRNEASTLTIINAIEGTAKRWNTTIEEGIEAVKKALTDGIFQYITNQNGERDAVASWPKEIMKSALDFVVSNINDTLSKEIDNKTNKSNVNRLKTMIDQNESVIADVGTNADIIENAISQNGQKFNETILQNLTDFTEEQFKIIQEQIKFDLNKFFHKQGACNKAVALITPNQSIMTDTFVRFENAAGHDDVSDHGQNLKAIYKVVYGENVDIKANGPFFQDSMLADGNIIIQFLDGGASSIIWVPDKINEFQLSQLKKLNSKIKTIYNSDPEYFDANPMEFTLGNSRNSIDCVNNIDEYIKLTEIKFNNNAQQNNSSDVEEVEERVNGRKEQRVDALSQTEEINKPAEIAESELEKVEAVQQSNAVKQDIVEEKIQPETDIPSPSQALEIQMSAENINENINENNVDIINVNELVINKDEKDADTQVNSSYGKYDVVYKVKNNVVESINSIINNMDKAKNNLIELSNTKELNRELIDKLPDNVEIRINGGYTTEYINALSSASEILDKVTYSKTELLEIITEIEKFENGIEESWTTMQKAEYAYNYLRDNIKYNPDPGGDATRAKQFSGLMGLVLKESTCQGNAQIYQELLNRMGIECLAVPGKFSGLKGGHAFNFVTIDNNTFIVDTVREHLEDGLKGNGFNISGEDLFSYVPDSYFEKFTELAYNEVKKILFDQEKFIKAVKEDNFMGTSFGNFIDDIFEMIAENDQILDVFGIKEELLKIQRDGYSNIETQESTHKDTIIQIFALNYLDNDSSKKDVILKLPLDELRMWSLKYIESDDIKTEIIDSVDLKLLKNMSYPFNIISNFPNKLKINAFLTYIETQDISTYDILSNGIRLLNSLETDVEKYDGFQKIMEYLIDKIDKDYNSFSYQIDNYIRNLSTDEYKFKVYEYIYKHNEKLSYEFSSFDINTNISDDYYKIKMLKYIDKHDITNVLKEISSEHIVNALEYLVDELHYNFKDWHGYGSLDFLLNVSKENQVKILKYFKVSDINDLISELSDENIVKTIDCLVNELHYAFDSLPIDFDILLKLNEENRIKILKYYQNSPFKLGLLIRDMNGENLFKALDYLDDESLKILIIKKLSNRLKVNSLNKLESSNSKIEVLLTVLDDYYLKEGINLLTDDEKIMLFNQGIKQYNLIRQLSSYILDNISPERLKDYLFDKDYSNLRQYVINSRYDNIALTEHEYSFLNILLDYGQLEIYLIKKYNGNLKEGLNFISNDQIDSSLLENLLYDGEWELFERLNDDVIYGFSVDEFMNNFKDKDLYQKIMQVYNNLNYRYKQTFKDGIVNNRENMTIEKIDTLVETINRMDYSNSTEVRRFSFELISELLKADNPIQKLEQIEDIFIRNNLPIVAKIYLVNMILHPDLQGFNFSEKSIMSPILKDSSNRKREAIIFADLLKAALGSNNRSIREYLENIELGNKIFEKIGKGEINVDELSIKEKEILDIFIAHLNTLYNNTLMGQNSNRVLSDNIINDAKELYSLFSRDGVIDYNLPNRIVRMFGYMAGFNTYDEMINYLNSKTIEADARNRERAIKGIKFSVGDLVKGIGNVDFLENIFQNGSVAREFLGDASATDATPLDTDLSLITSGSTLSEMIANTEANGYGPIWFVLKNDERFNTTRTIDGDITDNIRDLSKYELFYTGAIGRSHYGIRTGFASTDIDAIIVDEYDERIGLEIVRNGFYIPIYDRNTEQLLFSPDDYDKLRKRMQGFKYYGENSYTFSENLQIDGISDIVESLNNNEQEVFNKRTKIQSVVESVLDRFGLKLKTEIDGDLTYKIAEFIDTGSTGRGTNKRGDADFDFMLKLDRIIIMDSSQLDAVRQELLKAFGKEKLTPKDHVDDKNLRLKGVKIEGLDELVDIDISITQKTNKITYSTDMALKDVLETIRQQDYEKYKEIVANIQLAKKVLKDGECYKPHHTRDNPQGGLGGVGVENWILQNGGSFKDAAMEFLKAAEGKDYYQFTQEYKIWDFGENHFAVRDDKSGYKHDNFVYGNMSKTGFYKMVDTLNKFFGTNIQATEDYTGRIWVE